MEGKYIVLYAVTSNTLEYHNYVYSMYTLFWWIPYYDHTGSDSRKEKSKVRPVDA